MKINFINKIIEFLRNKIDFLNPNPYKIFYIGGKKNKNAGDLFNINLAKFFGLKHVKTKISNANCFFVGSILEFIVTPANSKLPKYDVNKCIIAGAGFIEKAKFEEQLTKEVDIRALRGKLSKERLEKILNKEINCTLADPGILASVIFPCKSDKKYKLGIIPHFIDKKSAYLKNIHVENTLLIDIEQEISEVLKQINECECIISSSLHGLIFSDSYNIPNQQMVLSDLIIGGEYKFKDYYSAYDMELPEIFDLRKNIITEENVKNIIKNYTNKSKAIKKKQLELIHIYEHLN